MAKYYKILKRNMKHYNMQYREGLNIDVNPFNPSPTCNGGLFFATKDQLYNFVNLGDLIADVEIPKGEKIVKVNGLITMKYKAHRINLLNIRNIFDESVLDEFKNEINFVNEIIVKAALQGNLQFLKTCTMRKIDLHFNNDILIDLSAINNVCLTNRFKILCFLANNQFDFNIHDSRPLRQAVACNNTAIIKMLLKLGVDIHAKNEEPLIRAIGNGNFEIVKLLVEYGANIHYDNDFPIKLADKKGPSEISDYLHSIKRRTQKEDR